MTETKDPNAALLARPAGSGTASDGIEKKFQKLRDEWKLKRAPESSSARLVSHPAYLKIIGMGPVAIPFLLRELQNDPDMWFAALRSITEADPVSAEIRGNVGAMAQAWLKWGSEQGYQW